MADPIPEHPGWSLPFALPGFEHDAIPFALRATLSLLLAYAVCFVAQIDAASSAGICVAIVAQPSAGMAFSKARYRLLGTVFGGAVGVLLLSAFPQDRTMLLLGYAVWLALCTFVGTLLRDFRSYGAVLSGYTAGIIAIASIDAPASGFTTALDRVAAITVGINAVLVVNTVFASTGAFRGLVDSLAERRRAVLAIAADALDGRALPDAMSLLGMANAISALRAQATFAGSELPDGWIRSNGARHTIEALLSLLSTSRILADAIGPGTPADWRDFLAEVAVALREGRRVDGEPPRATEPAHLLLRLGAEEIVSGAATAEAGLRTLEFGEEELPKLRVRISYDWVGALLGALRSTIAIGVCSVFIVVAGWPGATLLMIQATAIIALLGATPDPTKASLPFMVVLPPMAILVGLLKFLVLPLASGYVPFILVICPVAFLTALMVRQSSLMPYGTPSLLFFTLLLSPSNPQTFDFGAFCNTVMELLLSTVIVLLTFRLILPVSPPRRLGRVAAEIVGSWRAARHRADPRPPSLLYDRLSRVLQWIGPATPARRALVGQLYAMGELDGIERRARSALRAAGATAARSGAETGPLDAARRSLDGTDPAEISSSAASLLRAAPDGGDGPAGRAAAWMEAAAARLRGTPGLARLARRVIS